MAAPSIQLTCEQKRSLEAEITLNNDYPKASRLSVRTSNDNPLFKGRNFTAR
jgi:hypothetical protein